MGIVGAPDGQSMIAEIVTAVPVSPHGVWEIEGITQILEYNIPLNDAATIYTVPAGKTGYLTCIFFQVNNQGADDQGAWIYIYDDEDTAQALFELNIIEQTSKQVTISFSPPLRMGAGWYIQSERASTTVESSLTIHGYAI